MRDFLIIAKAQTAAIREIKGPAVIRMPEPCRESVKDRKKRQLDQCVEDFIGYAVKTILRWKALGADLEFIKGVLARIEIEIERVFAD